MFSVRFSDVSVVDISFCVHQESIDIYYLYITEKIKIRPFNKIKFTLRKFFNSKFFLYLFYSKKKGTIYIYIKDIRNSKTLKYFFKCVL